MHLALWITAMGKIPAIPKLIRNEVPDILPAAQTHNFPLAHAIHNITAHNRRYEFPQILHELFPSNPFPHVYPEIHIAKIDFHSLN